MIRNIIKIIINLKGFLIIDEKRSIEKYLNESTDIYDLEYRMRQIDRNRFMN